MSASLGTQDGLPVLNFDTGAGADRHPGIGLYYADLGGHVLVTPSTPLPTTAVATHTQDDDDAAASGHTLDEILPLNYGFDASLELPSLWIREFIWKDDTAPHADNLPLRGNGAFGTVISALGFPSGLAILGNDNMANLRLSQEGVLFTTDRNNEPFEVLNSQVDIALSASIASADIVVNSIIAAPSATNSLGRTILNGVVSYTGGAPAASSGLTVTIEVSFDSFATSVITDTYAVIEDTPTVIRGVDVGLAPEIRVTVTNDDGVNSATGVNIGFYLNNNG